MHFLQSSDSLYIVYPHHCNLLHSAIRVSSKAKQGVEGGGGEDR